MAANDSIMELVEFRFKVGNRNDAKSVGTHETSLKLSYLKISELDLSPIKNLAKITRLSLQSNRLENIDLEPLESCRLLEELYLHDNLLKSIDLEPLRNCSNLQRINLNRNQLSEIDLSPLSELKKLREINLIELGLESIDLNPLANSNIEILRLDNNQLTEVDLSALQSCRKLTELNLAFNRLSSIDLSPVPWSLRELVLYINEIQTINLEPLTHAYQLRVLRLERNSIREINLRPLWNSKLLHTLRLSNNKLTNLDVSALFNCSNLTTFEIDENVTLFANPDFKEILKIPDALEKHKPRMKWDAPRDQEPYLGRRKVLINPIGFDGIRLKHLYLQLITEINDTYSSASYTATMMLCRKLVENLLLEIILIRYKKGDAELEEFYEKGRVNDFSKLIDFFKQHKNELTNHAGISRRELDSMISKVKELNNKFNSFTHVLQRYAKENDVDKIKDKLSFIIDTLVVILVRS